VREPVAITGEVAPVDAHCERAVERGPTADRVEAVALQLLDPLRLRLSQRLLPRVDQVEASVLGCGVEAELRPEHLEIAIQLRRDEVGLRRLAGDVRTRAAPASAFHERDVRPELLRCLARAVPCSGSGAQHDQVVALHEGAVLRKRGA